MESFNLKPIGFFHCDEKSPHDLPRQAVSSQGNIGRIEFKDLFPIEQALDDIETCTKLWLIYVFHRNKNWRPKVQPPRGSHKKVGVLATRAPYRPNPIGLSCVDFYKIEGSSLWVKNHDLLDGSPILDIKPYLSFSDAFQDVFPGWMKEDNTFEVIILPEAEVKISWLSERVSANLKVVLHDQLGLNPFQSKRKRVKEIDQNTFIYSYKTWRFVFEVQEQTILVQDVYSGYSDEEMSMINLDPYKDKKIHRLFIKGFEEVITS